MEAVEKTKYYGLVLPNVFPNGASIQSIQHTEKTSESSKDNVFLITLTNGQEIPFKIRNGTGIAKVEQTKTSLSPSGMNEITVTDTDSPAHTYTFSVKNGVGIVKMEQVKSSRAGSDTNVFRFTDSEGVEKDFTVCNGNGIAKMEQTAKSDGEGDTQVFTFTDTNGNASDFEVKNGIGIEQLKALEKKFEEFNVVACPFPIGAVYTQYPRKKSPAELWTGTKWELLDYNGAFFRATGGNALPFDFAADFESAPTVSATAQAANRTTITLESTNGIVANSVLYLNELHESAVVKSVAGNVATLTKAFSYSYFKDVIYTPPVLSFTVSKADTAENKVTVNTVAGLFVGDVLSVKNSDVKYTISEIDATAKTLLFSEELDSATVAKTVLQFTAQSFATTVSAAITSANILTLAEAGFTDEKERVYNIAANGTLYVPALDKTYTVKAAKLTTKAITLTANVEAVKVETVTLSENVLKSSGEKLEAGQTLKIGSEWRTITAVAGNMVTIDSAFTDFKQGTGDISQREGLPNIAGTANYSYNAPYWNGASPVKGITSPFYPAGQSGVQKLFGNNGGSGGHNLGFDASRSSTIYGRSSHVTPENFTVQIWERVE